MSHWRLSDPLEPRTSPWSKTDFNYNDLRRDGDDEIHPYSYGSWKRGRWNTSGTSNGLDYGESNFYKPLKPFYGSPEFKKGTHCFGMNRRWECLISLTLVIYKWTKFVTLETLFLEKYIAMYTNISMIAEICIVSGEECTSERRPGMSLSTGSIRRSLQARNVVECEAACFEEREFKCVSYSYRYVILFYY